MTFRSLACVLALALSSGALHAQFSSTLKVLKRNHLVGEPVMVRVTLTNYTGQEQVLHGQRMPWISFIVKTSNGNPVHARGAVVPKPVSIAAGQTLARDFNLSQQFQLNQIGNYSVSAVIRPSDDAVDGVSTQRAHFQLSDGQTYWSQKVGNAGARSATRDFRILRFNSDKNAQLYVQIKDESTGRIIRTAKLGDVLMMRNPSMTIDGEQHLHVLFLTNPTTYLHYRISPDGEIKTAQMHRRAAVGDPKLTIVEQGQVLVTNSILFDPELAAKERAKIRNITDRPGS